MEEHPTLERQDKQQAALWTFATLPAEVSPGLGWSNELHRTALGIRRSEMVWPHFLLQHRTRIQYSAARDKIICCFHPILNKKHPKMAAIIPNKLAPPTSFCRQASLRLGSKNLGQLLLSMLSNTASHNKHTQDLINNKTKKRRGPSWRRTL
jgi:hypothetical protein